MVVGISLPELSTFDFVYWSFSSDIALLLLWNHMDLNREESSILILLFLIYMYLTAFIV